jgi:hypothetical protein
LNALPWRNARHTSTQVANRCGLLQAPSMGRRRRANGTVRVSALRVTINNIPAGSQRYHSLQIRARGASGRVAMQERYAFAKALERVSLLNAQDIILPSSFHHAGEAADGLRHSAHLFDGDSITAVRQGAEFEQHGRDDERDLGGWNVSAQYIYRSGQPIEFPNAAPLEARSAKLTASQRDEIARSKGGEKFNAAFDKWFDTTLFPRTAQAAFTLRDFPTRFPDVRGTYLQSWELSGYKEFRIKEQRACSCAPTQNVRLRLLWPDRQRQHYRQPVRTLNPAQDNQPRCAGDEGAVLVVLRPASGLAASVGGLRATNGAALARKRRGHGMRPLGQAEGEAPGRLDLFSTTASCRAGGRETTGTGARPFGSGRRVLGGVRWIGRTGGRGDRRPRRGGGDCRRLCANAGVLGRSAAIMPGGRPTGDSGRAGAEPGAGGDGFHCCAAGRRRWACTLGACGRFASVLVPGRAAGAADAGP